MPTSLCGSPGVPLQQKHGLLPDLRFKVCADSTDILSELHGEAQSGVPHLLDRVPLLCRVQRIQDPAASNAAKGPHREEVHLWLWVGLLALAPSPASARHPSGGPRGCGAGFRAELAG
eukprot:CAMPEP_0168473582 /NCGR_PEP_ID=MMETSP0228-20121227/60400_1 /TAXON_ID=133427 /ORGANISM="Protoceratium reticulatum, Strain CCCM 535 (=CCMP 1889)" /LENGTH=117 /DNA_ID=CAMNT_0008489583 /DNA_START=435 /DNA_END=785 /DNA_ORIENTATION=-